MLNIDKENIKTNIAYNRFFNFLEIVIFCFTKAGPITALNKVPGNEPIEKHAKNTPASDLSKI